MKLLFSTSVAVCLLISLSGSYLAHHSSVTLPNVTAPTAAPSHAIFDKLLKEHVNGTGMVDYKGFAKDKAQLKSYLDLLSKNAPASNWSKDEKLTYWINAYNAYTIQLILDHYPVKSIKDIGAKIKIPFVNTPWDVKFIKIGGETYDLNNLEHGIIRKQFDEPRIHFALVCAAKSCPRLRNEAYEPSRLDAQLDDQASDFINNPGKNSITAKQASLSKIFDWYGGDFKKMKNMTVPQVINKYSKTKITDDTKISYQTYDWGLNEQ
ncbi:hypothetical protein FAES_4980 [Fibrella aestuarina BUZ 2]|uniref:DUF547 domain-containing protein n=1 Tax=Fibrella aestuarina BUZ 2 TaxID=1166018 RepID=I0KFS6_9BACT|nr:DUF547 domain-containing protein [Fibrella aestuarina]CCH02979.1 hypothetical protein FAES_4980 [Fibrella aestuarina BUZ 2]